MLSFETNSGERLGVVAYAFLATRTPTKNRPSDERSFQIKYGNKRDFGEHNLHELWQDPTGLLTTILIGIDTDEGFFIAADPVLRNPTKFFIRVEFKDEHVSQIKKEKWWMWKRDRRASTRRPEAAEVLVGGTRDRVLELIRFERTALGASQAERYRLARRLSPA